MPEGGELPPLREVIAAHGLNAKKSLGQHFLFDLNLTRRIARAAGPLAGTTVLEIGPGPGGLTTGLWSSRATLSRRTNGQSWPPITSRASFVSLPIFPTMSARRFSSS